MPDVIILPNHRNRVRMTISCSEVSRDVFHHENAFQRNCSLPFSQPPSSSLNPLMKLAILCSLLLATAGILSCFADTVKISGSSTVYPIMRLASKSFTEATGIPVEATFSGTTRRFRKLLAGEVDIIGASRPILKDELAIAEDNAIEFAELPIAYDALTVAVHPSNTWVEDIKVSERKHLWHKASLGEKTLWSDLREGLPAEPIMLFAQFPLSTDAHPFD